MSFKGTFECPSFCFFECSWQPHSHYSKRRFSCQYHRLSFPEGAVKKSLKLSLCKPSAPKMIGSFPARENRFHTSTCIFRFRACKYPEAFLRSACLFWFCRPGAGILLYTFPHKMKKASKGKTKDCLFQEIGGFYTCLFVRN